MYVVITTFLVIGSPQVQDPDRSGAPLAAPLATPITPLAEFPPGLTPPPRVEVMQARRLADSGRHAEAARLLEALWRETSDPRLLYHAAIARGRAGQHTLALQHFNHFIALAGTLPADVRAHVDAKIAAETALLVNVRISVVERLSATTLPAPLTGARVTVEAAGVPPVAVDLASPVRLESGSWLVRVDLPGYQPAAVQQFVQAGPGEHVLEVVVVRKALPIELRFSPPKALRRAKLRLTATDRTDLPAIERAIDSPRMTVLLTTGAWQLAAASPRHAASLALAVGPDPRTVDVVLERRALTEAPRLRKHFKLVLGVGVAMGISFYAGVGVTVAGANIEGKATKKNRELLLAAGVPEDAAPDADALAAVEVDYKTAAFHHDLRRAANFSTAGPVVMMSGLGVILGVLPSLLETRRRAAYIELGVGAAVLAGGSVWLHDYLRRRDARLGPTDPAHRVSDSGLVGQRLGASMLTGLGIGLTVGSALTLLTDHLRRRKSSTALVPLAAPGHAGLLVRGQF